MFDKILLKTGEIAYIVEIYEQGVAYEADIDKADGSIKTDTIRHKDIEKILRRVWRNTFWTITVQCRQ